MTQDEVVKTLVAEAIQSGLSEHDTALLLAIARTESGFNPDAAAGTTSASGLGQFIIRNKKGKASGTGVKYGLNFNDVFDASANGAALIAEFKSIELESPQARLHGGSGRRADLQAPPRRRKFLKAKGPRITGV